MSSTRSIAQTSAVKMELSIGRAFSIIVLFRTAAHAVLSLSLGAIHEDIQVVRKVLEDIVKFFQKKYWKEYLFWQVHSVQESLQAF